MSRPREPGERRTWATRVVAATVVLVVGAAAAFALLAGAGGDPPTPERHPATLELVVPGQDRGQRCMVPSAAALGRADVAFEGEAARVDEGTVRLLPDRFYAGGPADEVVLSQPSGPLRDLVGAVQFEEGTRYLVAASEGQVMVCGFSGRHDTELADLYEKAFGRQRE